MSLFPENLAQAPCPWGSRSESTSTMVEEEEEESIQPLLKKRRTGEIRTTEICADVYGFEILSYLPARNVQALESVCKDWHQLIRSSDFVSLHLSRSNRSRFQVLVTSYHLRGILEYNNYNYYQKTNHQISYPPKFSVSSTIFGSVNGLIFMLQRSPECVTALFNPSTGKCFHVQLRPQYQREVHCAVCFWFGKLGDGEYGLVIVMFYEGARHEIWVYKFTQTSKIINRISSTEFVNLECFQLVEERGTFLQGIVHWSVKFDFDRPRSAILAYHIDEDRYFEISAPLQCDIGLGLFTDGCNLFATTNNMWLLAELWMMKQDHTWSKCANIEGFNDFRSLSPLGFSPDGGDLIMDVSKSRLMKYSFKNKEATLLMDHSPRRQVIMCADTLMSLGC